MPTELIRVTVDGKIYIRGEETTDKIKIGAAMLEVADIHARRPTSIVSLFISDLDQLGGE